MPGKEGQGQRDRGREGRRGRVKEEHERVKLEGGGVKQEGGRARQRERDTHNSGGRRERERQTGCSAGASSSSGDGERGCSSECGIDNPLSPFVDLQELFQFCNEQYFRGMLSAVKVEWSSKRCTASAGLCICDPPITPGGPVNITIRISEPLHKYRPQSDLIETLLHEMIHAYLFVQGDYRHSHGPRFYAEMDRVNRESGGAMPSGTHHHDFEEEVNHYQSHIFMCPGCRHQYARAMNRWPDMCPTCLCEVVKIAEPVPSKGQKVKAYATPLPTREQLYKTGVQVQRHRHENDTAAAKAPKTPRLTPTPLHTPKYAANVPLVPTLDTIPVRKPAVSPVHVWKDFLSPRVQLVLRHTQREREREREASQAKSGDMGWLSPDPPSYQFPLAQYPPVGNTGPYPTVGGPHHTVANPYATTNVYPGGLAGGIQSYGYPYMAGAAGGLAWPGIGVGTGFPQGTVPGCIGGMGGVGEQGATGLQGTIDGLQNLLTQLQAVQAASGIDTQPPQPIVNPPDTPAAPYGYNNYAVQPVNAIRGAGGRTVGVGGIGRTVGGANKGPRERERELERERARRKRILAKVRDASAVAAGEAERRAPVHIPAPVPVRDTTRPAAIQPRVRPGPNSHGERTRGGAPGGGDGGRTEQRERGQRRPRARSTPSCGERERERYADIKVEKKEEVFPRYRPGHPRGRAVWGTRSVPIEEDAPVLDFTGSSQQAVKQEVKAEPIDVLTEVLDFSESVTLPTPFASPYAKRNACGKSGTRSKKAKRARDPQRPASTGRQTERRRERERDISGSLRRNRQMQTPVKRETDPRPEDREREREPKKDRG
ncbi:hypothetical protein KIPB_005134 [Kipferlia bialata]|uniref:SprT-like domain-containing protein n=1 Tax=Kipferlia bialata TaxID=797122 RepID=A0A9K3CY35_9EUKA|nr:hypothetical protein KIPB_005134 [Kipferlia bialata]|eukprot:g5134.t1